MVSAPEEKSEWWEYFRLCELSDTELQEDRNGLGGLTFVGEVGRVKRSLVYRYSFPPQDHAFDRASEVHDPETGKSAGTIVDIDERNRTIDLRRGASSPAPHPTALVPFDIVGSTELRDSLLRIGYWVTDHGISGSGEFQSARKLLVRERPCVLRDFIGALIGEDQQLTGAAKVLLQSLASAATVLPIQGPPGYLDNLSKLNRAEKTLMAYRYTLTEWRKVCCKTYLDELVHQDLIDYIGSMKDAGLSRRTQDNRITTVKTFLMSVKKVCPLGLAIAVKDVRCSVKFVEKAVKAYTRTELAKLFAAADPEEWLLYHFFLATGARDEEVQTACYSDISDDGVYTVYVHPEWKFSPKDFECREVGVLPDYLLNAIRKRERISALIFPAKHGGRNHKMLRQLQALAVRAGLDPKSVGLHKFRKSFATFLHENGTSARTIQKRLGHSSLETTLAYLEAADVRSESSRATVNETFTPFAATNLSQESSIQ